MLKNNILSLIVASTMFMATPLFAQVGNQQVAGGRYMLGIGYGSYSGEDWVVQGGYISDSFLADIGSSYEKTTPASSDGFHIIEVRSNIGLRKNLSHGLHFDYGLLGSYGFRSHHSPSRTSPYEIGVFTGLSWNALPNLMMAVKISPYDYERSYNKGKNYRVFSEGSISVNYLLGG